MTKHKNYPRQTTMTPVGIESVIPASERPQAYSSDRTTRGIGENSFLRRPLFFN